MIELYAWGTTNGRRALIMVEETGLPFTLHQIDIRNGAQNTDAYEKLNPYRKIPAMVDPDGPGESRRHFLNPWPSAFTWPRKSAGCSARRRTIPMF